MPPTEVRLQQGFFDITPNDLNQLGPELAVEVLREMLWAEIHNLGIPITDTDIPFAVTTADGGVDADVRGTPKSGGNGLIFAPRTSFQVKAGDFSITAAAQSVIEELLISPKAITARKARKAEASGSEYKLDDISPRIRSTLDAGGTFITMLFGNDGIDTDDDAAARASDLGAS